jgi:hypothetical protein
MIRDENYRSKVIANSTPEPTDREVFFAIKKALRKKAEKKICKTKEEMKKYLKYTPTL